MLELCEVAEGAGVYEVSPIRVFVHIIDKVLDSHLGGSIYH